MRRKLRFRSRLAAFFPVRFVVIANEEKFDAVMLPGDSLYIKDGRGKVAHISYSWGTAKMDFSGWVSE